MLAENLYWRLNNNDRRRTSNIYKSSYNFMEDYLLKKGSLGIVDKGKIEIRLGHSCDEEVEVYTTLNLIKASFQFRN